MKKKQTFDSRAKGISRRDFIKTVGIGSLALSGLHYSPMKAWGLEVQSISGDVPVSFRAWTPMPYTT